MEEIRLGQEWMEYYDMFPYFTSTKIRQGCHPWKMITPNSKKAIVLIHGLSDSPYYMHDVARFFHEQLSYSVFIPLLQCHGLIEPNGMAGVSLEEWKNNVAMSVKVAGQHGEVSIGGLSTGATLGLCAVEEQEIITGCVYLFSAALAFAGGYIGRLKELIIRTRAADLLKFFDSHKPLIGPHPYRYAYVDRGAARELSRLIKEIAPIVTSYSSARPYKHKVFAIHHRTDKVVSFAAVQDFLTRVLPEHCRFIQVPDEIKVAHAGIILHKDILSPESNAVVLEKANPLFPQLLTAIAELEGERATVEPN